MTKIALLMTLMIGLFSFDTPKLVRTKLSKNISVSIPETFRPMTDDEIASRYFTYRKPMAMYTDTRSPVDFGVNTSECEWTYNDLEIMKSFYRASIKQTFTTVEIGRDGKRKGVHENVQMIKDEIKTINGHQFIVFEFVGEVAPDKYSAVPQKPLRNYSYMMYTIYKDELMLFNLTCPAKFQQEWAPVANEIMNSVSL